MKETINHYRLMRLQTDTAHAKYETTLAEEKHKIEQFLSEATQVCEEREKVLEKIEELKLANIREQAMFTEKYEGI